MREEICTPALDRVDELVLQGAHGDIWPLRHIEDLVCQAALWTARLLHLKVHGKLGMQQDHPASSNDDAVRSRGTTMRGLLLYSQRKTNALLNMHNINTVHEARRDKMHIRSQGYHCSACA